MGRLVQGSSVSVLISIILAQFCTSCAGPCVCRFRVFMAAFLWFFFLREFVFVGLIRGRESGLQ